MRHPRSERVWSSRVLWGTEPPHGPGKQRTCSGLQWATSRVAPCRTAEMKRKPWLLSRDCACCCCVSCPAKKRRKSESGGHPCRRMDRSRPSPDCPATIKQQSCFWGFSTLHQQRRLFLLPASIICCLLLTRPRIFCLLCPADPFHFRSFSTSFALYRVKQ